MFNLSKAGVLKWKKIFEEDYGMQLTYEEAYEATFNWLGFWNLLIEIDERLNPHLYKNANK